MESALFEQFGLRAFRPGQRTLIEAVQSGRDALAIMPTGGGKSLCYQFPALQMEGTALVISPLIALMKDQVDSLRARGIPARAYTSNLSGEERREIRDEYLDGRLKLLYLAPERLQTEGFKEWLGQKPISFVAIDEAHCISQWGHDFRPDYRRLGDVRTLAASTRPGRVPIIALTATATRHVQSDIVSGLGLEDPVQVITGFRRENLAFSLRACSNRKEKLAILEALSADAIQTGSIVIYAATRKHVELVAKELKAIPRFRKLVGHYHAGMDDEDRAEAQADFARGARPILVATNAFGMGIDQPDVRVVAHFDIPGSVEAYYQEAGRAGRDGKPARCALLFNFADVGTQEFLIRQGTEDPENRLQLLKQLVRYAYSKECRQKTILGYFGDREAETFERCGQCDRCATPVGVSTTFQADEALTLAGRKALSAVARLNGRFGRLRICEVLKGSATAQLLALGLQSQSTYGALGSWPLARIRALVDVLVESEYLTSSGLDYPVLSLTSSGIRAMKGEIPFQLTREVPGTRAAGDSGLLDLLKAFRREKASEKNVPAYVIFHDRTLMEIAAVKPRSPSELGEIAGVGPKKLETYGPGILALVAGAGVDI